MTTTIPNLGLGQPQQPTFPHISINILPQGMVITIQLGPTTAINQVLDPSTMDQVTSEWRKQRKNAIDIMHTIQTTKN